MKKIEFVPVTPTTDLLDASKEMITCLENYAGIADGDDPVHELLPRWHAAIARAESHSA